MKKLWLNSSGIICLLLLTTGVKAQQQQQHVNAFSLQQALDYGNKNSVQVKNALLDISIQEQVNKGVTAAAYPQINGNVSVTDYIDIPTTLVPGEFTGQPGTFFPVKFGTKWTSNAGVSLNQVVFDGQVFVGLKARKTTIAYSKKAAEITQEDVKANIYKVYYQLVAGKTQIDLLNANIERLEKLTHDTREMYKNGFVEKLDIDKLVVQITNLQTEKLKAETSIANGYSGLKVLIGMPIKDSLVLTDTLDDNQIRKDVLEGGEYKYTDRKDFQALQLNQQLLGLNVRRYKNSLYPTLNLNGNYSKQAQRNKFDFFDSKGDWFTTSYIGMQLNVPIFNGLGARARIQQSKLELQKANNQLEWLKINIDKSVQDSRANLATAIASMDFQKKNMELAENVYNQTKKKYEIGTGSSTEITTSQTDLKTAQTNYISSLYDAIIAKVDYLKATGKL